MKKALLILITVCSALLFSFTAFAAGSPEFAVSSAKAAPGSNVEVTVSVRNNPGLTSMKFNISYGTILQLEKVEYNQAFKGQTMQPGSMASPVTLIWLSPFENCNQNGEFATLTFKVSPSAKNGDSADVVLAYNPNDVYNLKEENVGFTVTNGKITVEKENSQAASGIELDKKSVTVKVGETETLTATVRPDNADNKNVNWASENTTVASVSNGKITGNKRGTTIVTATTEDGGYTAACSVTVVCDHKNKTKIPAKDSTCTEQGWDEYYVCDDCGQTLSSDGTGEVAARPFRRLAEHTGGKATCKCKAVCNVCGSYYGNYAPHSYNSETENEKTLKSEGTCCSNAVYYYSCSVCGECEKNDRHTFKGARGSHRFTKYVYNNDASGTQDGTETAKCDFCSATDTRSHKLNMYINAKKIANVAYNANVTVTATACNVPSGCKLALYDGDILVAAGDCEKVSYNAGNMTETKVFVIKIITSVGEIRKDSSGAELSRSTKVNVSCDLFAKLFALIRMLFGITPEVEIKP